MEEPDRIVLHYKMLEFLYNKCKLATSCFDHTWESFLHQHPEFQQLLTCSELKTLFWEDVAPNIEQYDLLTDKLKEYYHNGLITDLIEEALEQVLESNEPQKELDYICWKSEDGVTRNNNVRYTQKNIQMAFEEPNVCDTSKDEIKLNIIPVKPPSEHNSVHDCFGIKSLEINVYTEPDFLSNIMQLSINDITNRIRNENINKDPEHIGMFSDSYLRALKNFSGHIDEFLIGDAVSPTNSASDPAQLMSDLSLRSTQSSIVIPDISRTPTRSITRSTPKSTPRRRSAQRQTSRSQTPSGRITRSRRALVADPALNLKMSKFMDMLDKKN